jgi:hypothetical protein
MAVQNLNLVLNNLCAANAGQQGRDAVAKVLGLRMRPALSEGRLMSPGFAVIDPTVADRHVHVTYRAAKRIGRSAASLPGKPACSRFWREPVTGATTGGTGVFASAVGVTGRGLSDWCERHHSTSGHDYPSHDRRDVQQSTRSGQQPAGSAPIANRGK